MVFPDGRVVPGAMEADTIPSILDEGADAPPIEEVTIPAKGDPV